MMEDLESFFEERRMYLENRTKLQALRDFLVRLPYRIKNKIINTKNRIMWAFQRAYKGYDDRIYWAMDSYLTDILVDVLKHYRDEAVAHTLVDNADPRDDKTDEDYEKENQRKFKVIIDAFEIMQEKEPIERTKEEQKKVKVGLKLFAKYYEYFWD